MQKYPESVQKSLTEFGKHRIYQNFIEQSLFNNILQPIEEWNEECMCFYLSDLIYQSFSEQNNQKLNPVHIHKTLQFIFTENISNFFQLFLLKLNLTENTLLFFYIFKQIFGKNVAEEFEIIRLKLKNREFDNFQDFIIFSIAEFLRLIDQKNFLINYWANFMSNYHSIVKIVFVLENILKSEFFLKRNLKF